MLKNLIKSARKCHAHCFVAPSNMPYRRHRLCARKR